MGTSAFSALMFMTWDKVASEEESIQLIVITAQDDGSLKGFKQPIRGQVC